MKNNKKNPKPVKNLVKERVSKAFQLWNEDFAKYPEEFSELDTSKETADAQADTLISYLDKIPYK